MIPTNADLRQFILNFFSDEELETLCFDYFREAQQNFSDGMTKNRKVILLIGYCDTRGRLADLTAALERERPAAWREKFGAPPVETFRRNVSTPPTPARDPRQIFISHATADADFAHRLADDLRAEGWQVWIAPDNIRPGEKWVEAIERGLETSGVFVVALTPAAVASRWVRTETNAAIGLSQDDEIRFISLDVEPCRPGVLWRQFQYIGFRRSYEAGLGELLRWLEADSDAHSFYPIPLQKPQVASALGATNSSLKPTTELPSRSGSICPYCGAATFVTNVFCDNCGKVVNANDQFTAEERVKGQILRGSDGVEYLLLYAISQGGMGTVYKVRRVSDSTHWVMKEMTEKAFSRGDRTGAVVEFQKDAELLRGLRHENLPRIADLFAFNRRYYVIMEFIEGTTLGELLNSHSGPLPEKDVVGWGGQLCKVLGYLHTCKPPIIYQNLKPYSVMLETTTGHVKLIGFGIARHFKGGTSNDTFRLGTRAYAPPEQYGRVESDARADLYALGATLHHLLTNDDPANRQLFDFPSLDSYSHLKISRRTCQAIAAALQVPLEKRLQTAAEFYQMLTGKTMSPPSTF